MSCASPVSTLPSQCRTEPPFLIAFFPTVVNTAAGMRSVPTEMLDLALSTRAHGFTILRKIRFPFALPPMGLSSLACRTHGILTRGELLGTYLAQLPGFQAALTAGRAGPVSCSQGGVARVSAARVSTTLQRPPRA